MKVRFKVFDFVILLIFVFCLAATFVFVGKKSSGAKLSVKSPDGEYVYPLNRNAELKFKGLLGTTYVIIQNGEAWVSDSPCDNKVCIGMGHLSRANDWAACLPNGIMLFVEGETPELDAVAE